MATALRSLRVGEASAGYVLPFNKIRSGLWEAKHVESMDRAIWLYGWLHSRAHLKTGIVPHYTHDEAAEALGKARGTIGAK